MQSKERFIVSLLLLTLGSHALFDLFEDWKSGSSVGHLSVEGLVSLSSLIGATWLIIRFFKTRKQLLSTETQLSTMREESAAYLAGLAAAIEKQFELWKFSPAEREVALLLLKGMSLKEIADIRSVTERTVRQQSVAVYQKSGNAGRAELSAFFLEDLLL